MNPNLGERVIPLGESIGAKLIKECNVCDDKQLEEFFKEVLKKNPGSLVLMDLRSSNAVKEVIEEAGGKVNRCRVGHSLIKKQMREQGAVFAGELSGHYFFESNSGILLI